MKIEVESIKKIQASKGDVLVVELSSEINLNAYRSLKYEFDKSFRENGINVIFTWDDDIKNIIAIRKKK